MTTRRQLLAAAIAAPAIALPAPATALVCSQSTPSLDWQRAVARMQSTSNAASEYYETVYGPAREAWERNVADAEADLERRVEALPHYITRQTFTTPQGQARSLSTAFEMDRQVAANFYRRRADLSLEDADFAACCLELHPEAVRREEAEKALRDAFVRPAFDPVMEAESDRLDADSYAAWDGVVRFNAATMADLVAKIDFLKSHDCEIDHDELLADLARVFGGSAA